MFENELQRQEYIAAGWTFPTCRRCGRAAWRHGCVHPRDGDRDADRCAGYDADVASVDEALAGLRRALVPVAARETLTAEVARYRRLAATWELATWAALIEHLDKPTAERIAERMRGIVAEGHFADPAI